jgi:plastocyanin
MDATVIKHKNSLAPVVERQASAIQVVTRFAAATLMLMASASASLAQEAGLTLVIKDHRFQPEELRVPAGKKVKLLIDNQDATPEEFESHDLNREKVIPPKSRVTVFIGPLKPGRYTFLGEFHAETARGVVIAEP